MLSSPQINEYLLRIGIERFPVADHFFLRQLHQAHLYSIPFENLSIHCNEKIVLDYDKLFEKIVVRKRGGFCYELNGLFYLLITSLGYKAKMISAQVFNEDGIAGPEFDHMAIVVDINGTEYLCDVGFGDSFIEPILLKTDLEQTDRGRIYKIINILENKLRLVKSDDSITWFPQYDFTVKERSLDEYGPMCAFHQLSPDSTFTKKKICTVATPKGRITLRETRLIITEGRTKREVGFNGDEAFNEYLDIYFNIRLRNE